MVLAENNKNVYLAARNIPYLAVSEVSLLNTYKILSYKKIIFLKDSIEKIEAIFSKKKKEIKSPKSVNKQVKLKAKSKKLTLDKSGLKTKSRKKKLMPKTAKTAAKAKKTKK